MQAVAPDNVRLRVVFPQHLQEGDDGVLETGQVLFGESAIRVQMLLERPQLPNTTEETVGSNSHPGELSHQRAARVLTEYLQDYFSRTNADH